MADGDETTKTEGTDEAGTLDVLEQHVEDGIARIPDDVDRSALLEFMQTCMSINPDVMLDASNELRALVLAVQKHEAPGTLAIELKVEAINADQLQVTAMVKTKLPKAQRGTVLYFEDDGHLTADDPHQGELPL